MRDSRDLHGDLTVELGAAKGGCVWLTGANGELIFSCGGSDSKKCNDPAQAGRRDNGILEPLTLPDRSFRGQREKGKSEM
jgi:hypothetical protein